MDYDIDFLPVGEESKGGDAIVLRYGNLHGARTEQTVIVIDGGYNENGEALVKHIREHFGTNIVDTVISTHPDIDHITGLQVVLENMEVKQLAMHLPWDHSKELAAAKSVNFQSATITSKLKKSLDGAVSLKAIADRKKIPVVEPFAGDGTSDGYFRILGPSKDYYEELLQEILTKSAQRQQLSALTKTFASTESVVLAKLVAETLEDETLDASGVTTATNNTSVVGMLTVDGKQLLFTGDAGVPALEQVLDRLEGEGFLPGSLRFVQVPHHGSRRNVSPQVLDRLLGPKGQALAHSTAFVSAPKKNPKSKHPSKQVTNAFLRRGYRVHATQGGIKWHHSHNAPARLGWSASTPLPFFDMVEESGGA